MFADLVRRPHIRIGIVIAGGCNELGLSTNPCGFPNVVHR
ncbi:hypothetical protein SLNWT_5208 [Streptomyces albus]|uniref:Uncharacterized protein n=1 Tax=Streptomyces albus (strain ATCC 21838 / DSM 41398 / FERM P-419 / JCM 4703 / NBRC 107858) TaxID=1081613 RepID=A0A0B5EUY2_STRA4|nr:hypothetical protein SLNWT_5208 [Streptomyces albus]AOU79887.1 hypothetical protein SLNHY_5196 [Streptomyces albus]